MRNILLKICFDGTRYHGWQVQQNAVTVQQVMQDAAQRVLGERPGITGCGRTDAGVHAREYYCTLRTGASIACERLCAALCAHLPGDIAVMDARDVPDSFHPRYSVQAKEYRYHLWLARWRSPFWDAYALHSPRAVDIGAMRAAAACFTGRHDFAGFRSAGSGVEDTVREMYACDVASDGELCTVIMRGNGFLYNMARIIAGTVLDCGLGRLDPADMPGIIASRDRERAGPTLSAKGLALYRVDY